MDSKREQFRDAIRGGLYGGAVGDALGYPIEFRNTEEILYEYGKDGVTNYVLDKNTGKALISDDTQMTMFTANGILVGNTRAVHKGIQASPSIYIQKAYQDWCDTQFKQFEQYKALNKEHTSWLMDISELFHQRAPGNTCLKALLAGKSGTIQDKINDSKGCGGVMRVAPLGLHYERLSPEELVKEGAAIAALTHGHPLGYIPAGMLALLVNYGVYSKDSFTDICEAINCAKIVTDRVFQGEEYLQEFDAILQRTMELAKNSESDMSNISKLGEGWVAEETLAIAIYCCLRHTNSFADTVIAAVNHSGDSDSTGAVAGNIIGTWLGYEKIEDKWKHNLELSMIILEMADDLCYGCPIYETESHREEIWKEKYIGMKYSE